MSLITGTDLAKSYGAQDIFEGLSLEIPHGARIALVGANGCGKTTLLRLLAGIDPPTSGTIHRKRKLRIGYLPQQAQLEGKETLWQAMEAVFARLRSQAEQLRALETEMGSAGDREAAMERYGELLEAFEAAGGYTYTVRIEQVLSGLGFDPDDFHRPLMHLSGGQRTRALLAKLLLQDPDLLLLDEPTNHLDLEGVEWLEGHLAAWPGGIVMVAHDREFLDRLAQQVWELSFGQLTSYRGNYSQYTVQKAERTERLQEAYERQQDEIAHAEEYIQRHKAGQRSRQARGREKQLAHMERLERPREERIMHLDLGKPLRSGDLVLGLYQLQVGYDPHVPLFSVKEAELRRGQRVALLGPNGVGKTTLLRLILKEIEPLAGHVRLGAGVRPGYFAQTHSGLDRDRTLLDTILDAGLPSVSRARDLLGRYRFSGDDVHKRIGDLSGGEQARVALTVLSMQGANFLLMDEPTNHLDIPSQEILQQVLATFQGTVLLVAHDRYLIRALATHIWAIQDEQLWVFEEGYEFYRSWVQERLTGSAAAQEAKQSRETEWEAKRAAQREERQRARRQAEVEEAIHRAEARLAELEAELAEAGTAQQVERVTELGNEYARLQAELETQLQLWEDLG